MLGGLPWPVTLGWGWGEALAGGGGPTPFGISDGVTQFIHHDCPPAWAADSSRLVPRTKAAVSDSGLSH